MYYFGLLCSVVFYSSKLVCKDFYNGAQSFRFTVSKKQQHRTLKLT